MGELRTMPRWEIQKAIRVRIDDDVEHTSCLLEDVSFKGMRLSLQQALPIKRFIPMSLLLREGAESMNILADIRWSQRDQEKHTYGVYFQRMDTKHQGELHQFLNHCFSERWHHRWQKSEASFLSE